MNTLAAYRKDCTLSTVGFWSFGQQPKYQGMDAKRMPPGSQTIASTITTSIRYAMLIIPHFSTEAASAVYWEYEKSVSTAPILAAT